MNAFLLEQSDIYMCMGAHMHTRINIYTDCLQYMQILKKKFFKLSNDI